MPAQWLVYWKPNEIDNALNRGALDFAQSNQLRKVRPGDTLWVCGKRPREDLLTIGYIRVAKIMPDADARALFGDSITYFADVFAQAEAHDICQPRRVSLRPLYDRLRFESETSKLLKLDDDGQPSGQSLQTYRQLSASSEQLIGQLWNTSASSGDSPVAGSATRPRGDAHLQADVEAPIKRNPPWQDKELILALDLYLREGLLGPNHPEVIQLSARLNALRLDIERTDELRFRNPNGVALKLANFAAIDPEYPGSGMTAYGKLDAQIWERYAADEDGLREAVIRVRDGTGVVVEEPNKNEQRVTSVPVEALNVERFKVERLATSAEAVRREQRLVLDYQRHLEERGHRLVRRCYSIEGVVLYCDLFDETDGVLYEAKGDTTRASIRMAVGQLLDYRRFEKSPPSLALLLPRLPSRDILAFIASVGATCIYPDSKGHWSKA